jgi:RecA-family ATPase
MIAIWEVQDAATAARKRLRRAGYHPIPTSGKRPPIAGWTDIVATDAAIESWSKSFPGALNTGVLTKTTPAVDIDVSDSEVAAEIEALLWDMIGDRTMVRFGQAPKRAILFRTDTPFGKMSTPSFSSPNGQKHHVEVLCDGQQIVVLGIHPVTGNPYSWHGGEPVEVARADLPELTQAMAEAFIHKAADIMRTRGWTEETPRTKGGEHGVYSDAAAEFDAIYGDRERKYALAALRGCAAELATTPSGERNNRLNALAYRMGTMSARHWIERAEIIKELLAAAVACGLVADDGEAAARATLESGLSNGEQTPHPELEDGKTVPTATEPLTFIDMTKWDDEPPPPRQWSVRDRIPLRQPTLFSGEGAIGKTLLALQLASAHVLGRDWIGMLPEPGPAIYFGAEDDADELHRRLADIAAHYQVAFAHLIAGGLHLASFAGKNAILGAANHAGIIEPTPLFGRMHDAVCEVRPKTLVIDTSADVFAGNENDRMQVRQFVGLLRRLAIDGNCSVLLCSHPSLTGISTGTGLSGSTGWHNSVRARMFFRTAVTDKGEEPDPELRELVFMKNNYGPIGAKVVLRWVNGVFAPEPGQGTLQKAAAERKAEDVFLVLLDRIPNVSNKGGVSYAPALFAKEPEALAAKLSKEALANAMRRLFAANKVHMEQYGYPSRGTYRIAAGPKP